MEPYGNPQALDYLTETGDDLVDDKQIRAYCVAPDIVEHLIPYSDSSQDIWDAVQVEQWRFIRPLGRGGFGQVHMEEKVFERYPQSQGSRRQLRAVKVIPERDGGLRTMHHLPEILGMAKFSKFAASFIQLFAWFRLDLRICIAMELAPCGDLEDCVLKPLPESEVQEIVRQLSQAMIIMHERQFLHRDLKPKNVFVFRKPPESPEWRVKLGDFGVSKRVRDAAVTSWHTSIEADCSAPEVLGLLGGDYTEESSYANPVDMWSLGYLAHWLLTNHYPLTKFALPRHCRLMNPVPLTELASKHVSEQAVDFVENLLHLAPASRMTAQQAYSHPWLALSGRRSKSSLERPAVPYPLQPKLGSTVATSNQSSDQYPTPQSTESQPFGAHDRWSQSLADKSLYPNYRVPSQEAAPLLTNSSHQVKPASSDNLSIQVPDSGHKHEKGLDLQLEDFEALFSMPDKAKTHETIQEVKKQSGVSNPYFEPEKQHDRKALPAYYKGKPEANDLDPAKEEDDWKSTNLVNPVAQDDKKTGVQLTSIQKFDYNKVEAEWEAEVEAKAAEEVRNEENYMKRKTFQEAQKEEQSRRDAAMNDAELKEGERRAEEEEDRREEERNRRQVSETAKKIETSINGASSVNGDTARALGKAPSQVTNTADTLPRRDLDNSSGWRKDLNTRDKRIPKLDMPIPKYAGIPAKQISSDQDTRVAEARRVRTLRDRGGNIDELRQFSKNFTLKTPVPKNIFEILTKNSAKQEALIKSRNDAKLQPQIERPQKPKSAQTWATLIASGVQTQEPSKEQPLNSKDQVAKPDPIGYPTEPAKIALEDGELSKKQKRRRRKQGAKAK